MDRPASIALYWHDLRGISSVHHRADQADLLKQLPETPNLEQLGLEQVPVQQRRLAAHLRRTSHRARRPA